MTRARTIVLTGAARGIGRASAVELARRGHRLALIDRDADGLREVATEVGAEAEVADVSDRESTLAAIRALEGRVGPVDALIAVAGVGSLASAVEMDTPGLRRMLEVNVLGVAHAIEGVAPGMIARGSGHLAAVSSVAGFRGLPWMPGYSASKAAVSTYLEAIRPGLRRRGILVSTICPGFVRTGMTVDTPFRRPVPMLSAEQAAVEVARVVDRRPRDCVFPLSARIGMGVLRRLPAPLFDWMMDRAGPAALTTEF